MGSSRHCFNFDPESFLKREDVFVKDFATGHKARSVGIKAIDLGSDFFIFEVDFGEDSRTVAENTSALQLTDLKNPQGEALKIFGFSSGYRTLRPPHSKPELQNLRQQLRS